MLIGHLYYTRVHKTEMTGALEKGSSVHQISSWTSTACRKLNSFLVEKRRVKSQSVARDAAALRSEFIGATVDESGHCR